MRAGMAGIGMDSAVDAPGAAVAALRDDDEIREGASFRLMPEWKDVIFRTALRSLSQYGLSETDATESAYTQRCQFVIDSLAGRLGGEWMCVASEQYDGVGGDKPTQTDGTPLGFYIPHVRSVTFLCGSGGRHLFHVAQIFEPHVPQSASVSQRR